MKIVVIADTHGDLRKAQVPDGDLLLHCGDLDVETRTNLVRFNAELGQLPHRHKIVIAGNHDFFFEKHPEEARALLDQAIYLEDEEVVIEGLKIYGTPWTPAYLGMAFNLPRDGGALACKWAAIPPDVDVLMTHCPPRDILDCEGGQALGCDLLRYFLDAKQFAPVLHCFGHVHGGYGAARLGRTQFANAAFGERRRPPLVFHWDELIAVT